MEMDHVIGRLGAGVVTDKATRVMRTYRVLQNIANQMAISELLRLRITCPGWNRAFANSLEIKSTSFKLIKADPDGCALLAQSPCSEHITRRGLFQTSHSISSSCNSRNAVQFRNEIFNCVPNLACLHLELSLCQSEWWDSREFPFPRPQYQAPAPLQNLHRLVLNLRCGGEGQSSSIHWLLLDILANAPAIKFLSFGTSSLVVQALRSLQPQLLQELDIDIQLTIKMAEALHQLKEKCHPNPGGLRLTKLKVVVAHQDKPQFETLIQILCSFLAQQSNVLRQLHVRTHGSEAYDSILYLPHMEALETLEILPHGPEGREVRLILERQRMDVNFPNLKRLSYASATRHQFISEDLPLIGLQNITDLSLGDLEDAEVRRIADAFPSLLRLHLETRFELPGQYDDWLTHVSFACSAWPQLEALTISGSKWRWPLDARSTEVVPNLDELFTGIPGEFDNSENVDFMRTRQTRTGVGDLAQLREFSFIPPRCGRDVRRTAMKLTDMTGFCCFARPGSKVQRIQASWDAVDWSPACRAAIRQALGLAVVLDIDSPPTKDY